MSAEPTAGLGGAVAADAPEALVRPDDLVNAIADFLIVAHRPNRSDAHVRASDVLVGDFASADHITPGPWTAAGALQRALLRVSSEQVAVDGFDPAYRGQSPERLVGIAEALWTRHGGCWVEDATPVGLRLRDLVVEGGVVRPRNASPAVAPELGDAYADLAILASDLASAIGPAAVPALFDRYGIERPDPVRLEFWVVIDQLLR